MESLLLRSIQRQGEAMCNVHLSSLCFSLLKGIAGETLKDFSKIKLGTELAGEAEKEYWKKLRHAQGQRRDFSGGRGFNNRGYQDNWGRGRYDFSFKFYTIVSYKFIFQRLVNSCLESGDVSSAAYMGLHAMNLC